MTIPQNETENKKLNNEIMREVTGYSLAFPDTQEDIEKCMNKARQQGIEIGEKNALTNIVKKIAHTPEQFCELVKTESEKEDAIRKSERERIIGEIEAMVFITKCNNEPLEILSRGIRDIILKKLKKGESE